MRKPTSFVPLAALCGALLLSLPGVTTAAAAGVPPAGAPPPAATGAAPPPPPGAASPEGGGAPHAIATAPTAAAGTDEVGYPSGGETVHAYLAMPQALVGKTGPKPDKAAPRVKTPAVIVIHEWWGQNEWTRQKARDFAQKGYVALAVDLYRGQSADDADTAHQLMRGLPEDRALRDLKAAFTYLAGRPDVDAAHIGVVGWCMGGGYSLALAAAEPRLAAAVVYYGRLITDGDQIKKIKAPLLGSFGAQDKGIPAASVTAFAQQARRLGVAADFKIYPQAGHGFASSKDPQVFRAEDARDADQRTDAFFVQKLGAGVGGKK